MKLIFNSKVFTILALFLLTTPIFESKRSKSKNKKSYLYRMLSNSKEDSNGSCLGGICKIFSSSESNGSINVDDYENADKSFYQYHHIEDAPKFDKDVKKLNCGQIQVCVQLAMQKVFPKTLAQLTATYNSGKPVGENEDKWAVIKYTDQSIYDPLNWHLKSNFDKFLKDAAKIKFLDDVANRIDNYIGTTPVVGKVYRGSKVAGELKKNQVYHIPAYTSTSPSMETPLKYKGTGIIMEIEGTTSVPLIGVDVKGISAFKTEKEVLLARNQYLKYKGKGVVSYNNKDEEVYKFVTVDKKKFKKEKNILKKKLY